MSTTLEHPAKLAVLIDADNASPRISHAAERLIECVLAHWAAKRVKGRKDKSFGSGKLVKLPQIAQFAAKLKPGGEFRFGTDHAVYLRHALMVMRRHTHQFEWLVEGPQSWQQRPSGWCETRYEHKARTVYGHEVWYFRFRRK